MTVDVLFLAAVTSLLLHEMDAVDKEEWRLLFVLRRLPSRGGFRWFLVLHLPLYLGLMALIAADASPTVRWMKSAVDVFLIVHLGLHERLSAHGARAFANPFSRTMIWSAAGFGLLHLAASTLDVF